MKCGQVMAQNACLCTFLKTTHTDLHLWPLKWIGLSALVWVMYPWTYINVDIKLLKIWPWMHFYVGSPNDLDLWNQDKCDFDPWPRKWTGFLALVWPAMGNVTMKLYNCRCTKLWPERYWRTEAQWHWPKNILRHWMYYKNCLDVFWEISKGRYHEGLSDWWSVIGSPLKAQCAKC